MIDAREQISKGIDLTKRIANEGTRTAAGTLRQLDALLASGSIANARAAVTATERRHAALTALESQGSLGRTA